MNTSRVTNDKSCHLIYWISLINIFVWNSIPQFISDEYLSSQPPLTLLLQNSYLLFINSADIEVTHFHCHGWKLQSMFNISAIGLKEKSILIFKRQLLKLKPYTILILKCCFLPSFVNCHFHFAWESFEWSWYWCFEIF